MSRAKFINSKGERPLYENKAVAPLVVKGNIRIVVVKAHDGLQVGESYVKDVNTAAKMVQLGYWRYE
jgi:hypothetical protein